MTREKVFTIKLLQKRTETIKKLYSYDTLVAEIKDNKFISYGDFSMTTRRHQREFARQNGFVF